MKRGLIFITSFIIVALVVTVIFYENHKTTAPITSPSDPERSLNFFIDTVTSKVQATVIDYQKLGLAGGVDGFVLMKTFPKLLPLDFINVRATGGDYSVEKGKLLYTGNAASNSAVLTREGMRTLLKNCSERLKLLSDTREGVIEIVAQLEGALKSK